MGEKSGVVGKVVHYYWIIESAKKWIMECVNEHELFRCRFFCHFFCDFL